MTLNRYIILLISAFARLFVSFLVFVAIAFGLFNLEIKLTNLQRGRYFRVVANVVVDGVSLEQELLDNKLAYEYSGVKKLS
jgi:hypothetical protein